MVQKDRRFEYSKRRIGAASREAGEARDRAMTVALGERLERLLRKRSGRRLARELDEIALHSASMPVLDSRDAEELLGYDKNGQPS